MAGIDVGQVIGVDATLRDLDRLEEDLYQGLLREMDSIANAMAGQIQAAPPDPPLSGMEHNGRTGWGNRGTVRAKKHPRRKTVREWPLYRVSMGGYGNAVTDLAGSGSRGMTPQGTAMIDALNRNGRASRWAWPIAKGSESKIVAAAKHAADKAADVATQRMAE